MSIRQRVQRLEEQAAAERGRTAPQRNVVLEVACLLHRLDAGEMLTAAEIGPRAAAVLEVVARMDEKYRLILDLNRRLEAGELTQEERESEFNELSRRWRSDGEQV